MLWPGVATHHDEPAVGAAPSVERMVVHWYGTVDKIGRNFSGHSRVVFVTDAAVYVCLPTGGVTRVVPLEKAHLAYRAPAHVAQLFEDGGVCLVTRHTTDRDRDAFVAAVKNARFTLTGEPTAVEDVSSYAFESAPTGGGPSVSPERRPDRASSVAEPAHRTPAASGRGSAALLVPPHLQRQDVPVPTHHEDSMSRATSQAASTLGSTLRDGKLLLDSARDSPARNDGEGRREPAANGIAFPANPFEEQRFAIDELRAYQPLPMETDYAPASHKPSPQQRADHDSARDAAPHVHRFAAATKTAFEVERDGAQSTTESTLVRFERPQDDTQPAPTGAGVGKSSHPAASAAIGMRPSAKQSNTTTPMPRGDVTPPVTSTPRSRTPVTVPAAAPHAPEEKHRTDRFAERHRARDEQLADLNHAVGAGVEVVDTPSFQALRRKVEAQSQVISELRHASDTLQVNELMRDLDHARGLITDLQTALRAQESTFKEMVLAQETARTAQAIQSSLEAQVRALTQERDTLRAEALGGRKEADALRAEVERRERHHDKELLKVREAFVQYDANVAEYLEEVRLEHAEDLQRARKEAREELLASRAGSAALPRQLNEYPADRAPATHRRSSSSSSRDRPTTIPEHAAVRTASLPTCYGLR
jgi:hypothetical protein